jgi:hypothetical protein
MHIKKLQKFSRFCSQIEVPKFFPCQQPLFPVSAPPVLEARIPKVVTKAWGADL